MPSFFHRLRDGGFACALLWACHAGPAFCADDGDAVSASFDCASATGVDERVICADVLLRGLDAELNRRYRALLEQAQGDAQAVALRADERAWIIQRNNECRVFKGLTIGSDEMRDYVDCFIAAYEERMADMDVLVAKPGTDPQTVSNPIRRSLYAQPATAAPELTTATVDTGIVPAYVDDGALEFTGDGALLVLGSGGSPARTALFEWRPAGAVIARAELGPDAVVSHRLCATTDGVALLPRVDGADVLLLDAAGARAVATAELPEKLKLACGVSTGRRLFGARMAAKALDMGPLNWNTAGAKERYATLVDAAGGRPTSPPLRIDRRYRQVATYSRAAGGFVVYPGHRPKGIRSVALRRWAKSGCDPYWVVNEGTAEVVRQCVPYGAYAETTLTLLPARDAMYFAAGRAGLYRIEDGSSRMLDKRPAYGATVAPDGCTIAFIAADDSKKASAATVQILPICR